MSKIIITGVSGQDGSYMAELLSGGENKVYGIVRHVSKPDHSNLQEVMKRPQFKLITGDLTDTQSIDRIVSEIQPDYFINLGAQSFVGSSWKLPETTFDVNALGTLRCLEAIRKFAPKCRFYQASTSEMFGEVEYGPQDELHPFRPQSPYGAAKVAAHMLTRVYRESFNLYAVCGTLFNHESERRGEQFVTRKISKGVARIWKELNILKSETFEPIVLGNLESVRDWSHAEDFVKAIWLMLNQEKVREGLDKESWDVVVKNLREYVVASGEKYEVHDFIKAAFEAAGIEIVDANPDRLPLAFGDKSQQIAYSLKDGRPVVTISREFYRPAEVGFLHGDATNIKRDLGWIPKISFGGLVRRMVGNDIEKVLSE